jgi:Ca2+-transporting ATPase
MTEEKAERNWHALPAEEVLTVLSSHPGGLSAAEAELRLQKFGPNRLPAGRVDGLGIIFLRQFQSPLIYTLLAATAVIFALGEIIDGFVVIFVLLFNAVVGTIQEGRAQNTLLALKKITETTATVLRDNDELSVKDELVVPGDIIILEEGQRVPADARLLESVHLKVDEASLTGESEPITKTEAILPDQPLLLPDRLNLVFKGTYVVSGAGRAVVVATGLKTEIGQIAEKIGLVDTEIPLKKSIRHLSKVIVAIAAAISAVLIALGLLVGRPLAEMFITAVALLVSVIPEGLPIVMTLVLATGVWRMSKRQALVKRLQAVEALGQTKIVAVDKTGTLTKNEMVIQRIYTGDREFDVGGQGYEPKGVFSAEGQPINPAEEPALLRLIRLAGISAKARLFYSPTAKVWQIAGDPTEAALLVLAEKAGLNHHVLKNESPLLTELPFSHQTKFHAVVNMIDGVEYLTAVGAPEALLRF